MMMALYVLIPNTIFAAYCLVISLFGRAPGPRRAVRGLTANSEVALALFCGLWIMYVLMVRRESDPMVSTMWTTWLFCSSLVVGLHFTGPCGGRHFVYLPNVSTTRGKQSGREACSNDDGTSAAEPEGNAPWHSWIIPVALLICYGMHLSSLSSFVRISAQQFATP